MAVVKYTIVSGVAPFVAELTPSSVPENIHLDTGTYEFTDVPNGGYTIMVTDSNGCVFQQEITVDPLVTTTTTTLAPGNSIVVGNTQDNSLIFNINGTNRSSHYSGYPNANTATLFLWLKTLNGIPLVTEQIINYSITASKDSTFAFNALSDEIHTNVIQNNTGPATTINGQLYLKTGFIESYFQYTYQKKTVPSYQIDLTSNGEWLYINIPKTSGSNIYGVTYIDRDNVIMNF
jgi:hypothetical protein